MVTSSAATYAVASFVGALSGLHTATWGMYKDAQYEGFTWPKYLRSAVLGICAALVVEALFRFDLATASGAVMLFGMAYVLERGMVEFHKSFIRTEDQSKYFIPMAFAVGGRVVPSGPARVAAGIAYATVVGMVLAALESLQRNGRGLSPLTLLLAAGCTGGWISAFGGAWKDAPKEGFQLLKFFRSPVVSLVYALLLSTLTDRLVVIAFGALGFTIATIETHKMFDQTHVRGKFAGKPVLFPETLELRRRFVPIVVLTWILVLGAIGVTLAQPQGGLLAAVDLAVLP